TRRPGSRRPNRDAVMTMKAEGPPMRRAILGLYTYAEFFASAVIFLAPMGLATLRTGDAPGRRIRGRWMRRFGKCASSLTPIWSFRAEGTPPADIDEKA